MVLNKLNTGRKCTDKPTKIPVLNQSERALSPAQPYLSDLVQYYARPK